MDGRNMILGAKGPAAQFVQQFRGPSDERAVGGGVCEGIKAKATMTGRCSSPANAPKWTWLRSGMGWVIGWLRVKELLPLPPVPPLCSAAFILPDPPLCEEHWPPKRTWTFIKIGLAGKFRTAMAQADLASVWSNLDY